VPEPTENRGPSEAWRQDVHLVEVDGRQVYVVGTAHISRESVEVVKRAIETLRPERVCIELDERRFEALSRPQRFEALNLREIIRTQQLATLMLNMVLAGYQRSLGLQLGVQPGSELLAAARGAEAQGIGVELVDRDVRVTLRRAWAALSLWQKILLVSSFLGGMFERQELGEDDLRELRQQDVLSRLMEELGTQFPRLKTALIDERDVYLAERIRRTAGDRLVAVVGAGHVQGILRQLRTGHGVDLAPLEEVPEGTRVWKWVGWGIPALILGALVAIGVRQGAGAAGENLAFWILANGVPCALGTVLALGHPATVVAGFLSAPVTSLTPVIGAGYVTAFVQTWLVPPRVRELSHVFQDMVQPTGWWRNRLLRVFLVFLLSTVGSLIGTWVGGARIFSSLVQ